jgi:hypothetical protein
MLTKGEGTVGQFMWQAKIHKMQIEGLKVIFFFLIFWFGDSYEINSTV